MEEGIREYFRTNLGGTLEIWKKKGTRDYNGALGTKRKDYRFWLKLISAKDYLNTENGEREPISIEFLYSYSDQHRMMELVLDNIILDHVFDREYNNFISVMETIKKRRTAKDKKLSEFGG